VIPQLDMPSIPRLKKEENRDFDYGVVHTPRVTLHSVGLIFTLPYFALLCFCRVDRVYQKSRHSKKYLKMKII
jgi:hypothetical protein